MFPEDKEHGDRILHEIKRVLKLYTKLLGNPPIWKGYTVIEIPNDWGGQACMTGALLPASSIRDSGKISGLYHEIAHLWNVISGEEPPSRFLDEGLASFLQLVAEEKLLNRDLGKRIDELRQKFLDMTRKHPSLGEISVKEYGRYGLTEASYLIGPIILYIAKDLLRENCLWNALRTFIEEYSEKPAKLEDLVYMFEKTCGSKTGRLLEKLLFTNKLVKLLCEKNSIQEILRELRSSMSSTLG